MKTLTDNIIPHRPSRFTLRASLLTLLSALSEPGNPPKYGQYPYIPNEPNFKTSRLTVTLDMITTYNADCPKKRKKNEPKTSKK